MAAVQATPQARDYLSCCSRSDESGTIQIVSSLSHNPPHAQSLALIRSQKPTFTSNDQPDLCLDAFMGYKRDQPPNPMSSSHQIFPGSACLYFPEFRLL
jgi:hypothetical protein